MSIKAEDIEKAINLVSGLYKFEPDGLFEQAVLALTPEAILIYNDNAPDLVDGADWTYQVKVRLPLTSIELVTNEVIKSKRKIKQITNRLTINSKNEEKKVYQFYYDNTNNKLASNFISGLKHHKVKTKVAETTLTY